jgi:transposase InsO family protein
VPTLQERFPDLARAELTDLLKGFRQVLRHRRRDDMRRLHWLVPGRVWAIDFAEPSELGAAWSLPPIDDEYPYLLAVRDLASGYQLAWLPVHQATAEVTQAALATLFEQHGAPLVLKADNGPPFRADQTKSLLQKAEVRFLFSPPYWPAYNGAIEAAIGALKRRTEEHAAQQGHARRWTWADALAARAQANAARPRRLHGLSPAELWAARTRITATERVRFELAVERQSFLARREMNIAQEQQLDHWQASAVDRKAIERALVEHDYLLFRRRRLPLTIKVEKVTSCV